MTKQPRGPFLKGRLIAAAAAMTIAAAPLSTATAHADAVDDAFLAALDQAGIHYDNADVAKAMAKSVCPQLVQPGKSFAYVVTEIQGNGVPPGLAAWFAGIAVKMYCPAMMKSVTNGTFFQWIQAPHI